MEQLYWKIDLNATCPHCGEESDYVFYLNTDTLICNKCEEEFNIELWARDIEVRATK